MPPFCCTTRVKDIPVLFTASGRYQCSFMRENQVTALAHTVPMEDSHVALYSDYNPASDCACEVTDGGSIQSVKEQFPCLHRCMKGAGTKPHGSKEGDQLARGGDAIYKHLRRHAGSIYSHSMIKIQDKHQNSSGSRIPRTRVN